MTANGQFVNAIDTLNKLAKEEGYQGAKDWAYNASKRGIITIDESMEISRYVDLRNTMCHGNFDLVSVTEREVARVNQYINILTSGRIKEPIRVPVQAGAQRQAPVHIGTISSEPLLPIATRNVKLKFNGQMVCLADIKCTCCDWGDEQGWPSLEVVYMSGEIKTIHYNENARDLDGDTPEAYCKQYSLFYKENGEYFCDLLGATRQMLQSDITRAYEKCDKSAIYLDSLIVNAQNISSIKADGTYIAVSLINGEVLETEYTKDSCDHDGHGADDYVKEYSLYTKDGLAIYPNYDEACLLMAKYDYEHAMKLYKKYQRRK